MKVTHIGGPTLLIEVGGWRILTDPTFDPPGKTYGFGWGTSSKKTLGPALSTTDVGPIDVVLLSHDHHADNLDTAGRRLLREVPRVITTRPGSKRLRHELLAKVHGLAPGKSLNVREPDRSELHVTATPARHGPPLGQFIAGTVIGFVLDVTDDGVRRRIWVTGDTVLARRVRALARGLAVDVAVLHMGGVRFPSTGPLRYSMVAADATRLVTLLNPCVAIPVHYDGWSHFGEDQSHARAALRAAGTAARTQILWLEPGQSTDLNPVPHVSELPRCADADPGHPAPHIPGPS
ncbi:MBL fold metallo-hydrolase [Nocardioides aestuarii]|uniref:MBL fold metallo-hydrolase n=1 Tax=Nocardioides aestuarii TaxID=252231 RepID=A0ABW4TL36_9ACTN